MPALRAKQLFLQKCLCSAVASQVLDLYESSDEDMRGFSSDESDDEVAAEPELASEEMNIDGGGEEEDLTLPEEEILGEDETEGEMTIWMLNPDTFDALVSELRGNPAFINKSNIPQMDIEDQLIITLYRLGQYGNSASVEDISLWAGVAVGTVELVTRRVIRAVLTSGLRERYVRMPTEEETERQKQWVEDVSCERLVREREKILKEGEWCWADAGYPIEDWLPILYKEGEDKDSPENIAFDLALSRVRVKSENAIGYLKGRWQALRELRIMINSKDDVAFLNLIIHVCIILHNFALIHEQEHEEAWRPDEEFLSEGRLLDQQSRTPIVPANQQRVSGRRNTSRKARDADLQRARAFREKLKRCLLEQINAHA
ncbi:hypothetical protein RUND412_002418 [Rhizina undulata]